MSNQTPKKDQPLPVIFMALEDLTENKLRIVAVPVPFEIYETLFKQAVGEKTVVERDLDEIAPAAIIPLVARIGEAKMFTQESVRKLLGLPPDVTDGDHRGAQ